MPNEKKITDANKLKILQRLKKIEGQIRGIQGMVADDRPCEDLLIQVSAVRSAIHSIGKLILEEKVNSCFHYSKKIYLTQSAIDEIIELIIKFVQ
ncbi:MAG: metal-sensitive transcriptional regulator [Atribacterota bacterium]|nr:metal-sensitive transcriptional regulator [Atribacterota bacterium]